MVEISLPGDTGDPRRDPTRDAEPPVPSRVEGRDERHADDWVVCDPAVGAGRTSVADLPRHRTPGDPAAGHVRTGDIAAGDAGVPDGAGEERLPASRRLLVAAAVAGGSAAVALPWDRPGIGWLLTGVAVATGAGLAARGPGWRSAAVTRFGFGLAALALLGVGATRAAGWLFLFCVVAAAVTGSFAVAGGRGWRGLLTGAVAVPLAAARAPRWAARGALASKRPAPGSTRRLSQSLAVGAVLVALFGGLLAGADAVFAAKLSGTAAGLSPGRVVLFLLSFGLAAAAVIGVGYLRSTPALAAEDLPEPPRTLFGRLDWVVPLAMLDALFASFVGVQVAVLFRGHEYVLDAGGPSYAEYARAGFTNLLAVVALTLPVIAVVARKAARDRLADRVLIRTLVGGLCLLTLLILASALNRLALYVDAYGFTRFRVLAAAGGVFVGLILVCVLAAGVRMRAPWLPRVAAGLATAALLGVAAVNPDALIADTVVKRFTSDGHLDAAYLAGLSVDAVDAIDRLPEPARSCLLAQVTDGLGAGDPWYAYNAARQHARAVIAAHPVEPCNTPKYMA